MFTHEQIWRLIDQLAKRANLTPSGLARRAGMDATSFSPSKRTRPDGAKRWPSTESLSRALTAADVEPAEISRLLAPVPLMPRRLPAIELNRIDAGDFDDKARPQGRHWGSTGFADRGHPQSLALRITDAACEPVFPVGSTVIVSPATRPADGERLLIVPRDGVVLLRELKGRTRLGLIVKPVNRAGPVRTLLRRDVRWIFRVRWCQF